MMATEYSAKAKEMRETIKLQLEMTSEFQKKANEIQAGAFSDMEMKLQPVIQKTISAKQIADTVKDQNPERRTPIYAKKGVKII